jgi:hypothetical protein
VVVKIAPPEPRRSASGLQVKFQRANVKIEQRAYPVAFLCETIDPEHCRLTCGAAARLASARRIEAAGDNAKQRMFEFHLNLGPVPTGTHGAAADGTFEIICTTIIRIIVVDDNADHDGLMPCRSMVELNVRPSQREH